MSEQQTVTERDAVLRERYAFVLGATANLFPLMTSEVDKAKAEAERRYPLPPVTRRRELRFHGMEDCVVRVRADATVDFPFEYTRSDMGGAWTVLSIHRKYATPGTVYGDLLLNPDETVPDDGGAR